MRDHGESALCIRDAIASRKRLRLEGEPHLTGVGIASNDGKRRHPVSVKLVRERIGSLSRNFADRYNSQQEHKSKSNADEETSPAKMSHDTVTAGVTPASTAGGK